MIVDDEKDIAFIMSRMLQKENYDVESFSDPAIALDHFKHNSDNYDLLLTDIKMPGISGFEMAKLFKEINHDIRVLFTTAYETENEELRKKMSPFMSADDEVSTLLIEKPAKGERIVAAVKEALSDRRSLKNPVANEHIVLFYSGNEGWDNYFDAIAEYINEGLKRNQLCIYTYIEKDEAGAMEKLAPKIIDYEEIIRKKNLVLIDFKPHCISARDDNLEPFEKMIREIGSHVQQREDRHVRVVGRAAGWLFENKYFDQCLALERWWHTKPFYGSLVCPFDKSVLEKHQFLARKDPIFTRHDTIITV